MREVTVEKERLLATIRSNRGSHRQAFEKALDDWQAAVIRALEEAAQDARSGKDYRWQFHLPAPMDHTGDYDDVIGMLEMHTESTVTLGVAEYRQYVTDDWDWKPGFTATTERYAVGR